MSNRRRANVGPQKLVSQLEQLIHQLSLSNGVRGAGGNNGSRRRRRRRGRGTRSSPGLPQAGGSPTVRGAAGQLTITHTEYWGDVKGGVVTAFGFYPGGSGLGHLDNLAKSYERYVIKRARVEYRPAVGTTADGVNTMGVEWDTGGVPANVKGIVVCQPNAQTPVWKEAAMNLPSHRLMPQRYLKCTGTLAYDTTAFSVYVHSSGKASTVQGAVWISYTVTLEGPRLST